MYPVIDRTNNRPVALFLVKGDADRWCNRINYQSTYFVGKKVSVFAPIVSLFVRKDRAAA